MSFCVANFYPSRMFVGALLFWNSRNTESQWEQKDKIGDEVDVGRFLDVIGKSLENHLKIIGKDIIIIMAIFGLNI